MSRKKPYGRAFKISEKEAKSYSRSSGSLRPNPMGVTAMSSVNGKGAYARSARQVAEGKTRGERLARARRVLRNGSGEGMAQAAFLKNSVRPKRSGSTVAQKRGYRLQALKQARDQGLPDKEAAVFAVRKVPLAPGESFKGHVGGARKSIGTKRKKARKTVKKPFGFRVSAPKRKRAAAPKKAVTKTKTKRAAPKRKAAPKRRKVSATTAARRKLPTRLRLKDPATGKTRKSWIYRTKDGKRRKISQKRILSAYPKTDVTKLRGRAADRILKGRDLFVPNAKKRKRRVAARKPSRIAPKGRGYTRLRLTDPATGRKRLSYAYRTKAGKIRKIPDKYIIKYAGTPEQQERAANRIVKARARAADKVVKRGAAFVPNRRKTVAKKKSKKKSGKAGNVRRGKRLAAYSAAKRAGKSKEAARKAAIAKVPLLAGESFGGATKKKTSKKKRKVGTKKRRVVKKRKSSKRRKTTALAKAPKRTKKRKGTKRRVTKKRKSSKRRKTSLALAPKRTKKRRTRRTASVTITASPRKKGKGVKLRVRRRKYRKNGRGMFRSNSAMISTLKSLFKTGVLVASGFLGHKAITNFVLVENVFDRVAVNVTALQGPAMQNWKKPLMGVVALLAAGPLVRKVLPKQSSEIIAGMAASVVQSAVFSLFVQFNKPAWATQYLSGYSNSRAYQLRGRGVGGHQQSIMPHYAMLSGYEQAAAGLRGLRGYEQAAAGTGEYFQNGTGEYFTQNATGEYFANNLQGVGSYEAAGELAMQAAAGSDDIDDGIRPDSNIDGLLDLAEAAAGLRGPTGDFFTAVQASGGRVVEKRVGENSQWVPSGPLWAGETGVTDNQATSELSAGILSRRGGNGSLSA